MKNRQHPPPSPPRKSAGNTGTHSRRLRQAANQKDTLRAESQTAGIRQTVISSLRQKKKCYRHAHYFSQVAPHLWQTTAEIRHCLTAISASHVGFPCGRARASCLSAGIRKERGGNPTHTNAEEGSVPSGTALARKDKWLPLLGECHFIGRV